MRRLALLIAALPLLLASCRPAATTTAAAAGRRDQTLLLGNSSEPGDLDPQTATALTEMNVLVALFEGLTCLDEKTSQPQPGVAERWEISPDGLVYTFHLRANARWSNGNPLTARDFAWSYQRILSPKLASEYSYMLWPIKNAEAYNEGKVTDFAQVGVKAADDRTLEITLGAPCPWLLALAAHQTWFPVHRATLEKFGAAERQGTPWTRPENLVGNGPFTLAEWSPNARIVVAKNPHYWDAMHTTLQRVEFFPIENQATEEKTYRAGQLHVTYGLPPAKIAAWRADAPGQLRVDPLLETFFLRCNVTKPPLDNVKLRQALARAVDRTALANTILHGSVVPAHALTPPGTAGYQPPAGVPDDFAAARRLLAEAGFPGGKGLPTFEVQIKADDIHRAVLEAIQQMWARELGVNITIVPLEQKTWLQNQQTQAYQISSARWVGDYVDPNTYLDLWLTNGGNNWTGWGNAAYDQLVTGAAHTLDTPRRQALQQQAEALLLDQGPIIPIYYGARVYLIDPGVKGWVPNLLGIHRYQTISLE
jgi:oligopeptide transport system substrate-binding protein